MRQVVLGMAAWAAAVSLAGAAARPAIATFSKDDAARAFGAGCGVGPSGKVRVKRAATGNMISAVGERQSEAVIYPDSVRCHKIGEEVLDLWRTEKGNAVAQLIDRSDGARLLVGANAEIRGKRFDVDRTGQYLVVSQGTASTLSSIAKPYIKLLDLDNFDAQRIFVRRGSILLVGDNPATRRLEGRVVRVGPEGVSLDPTPVPMGEMPAGVRVLDYSEESDDLLLGGLDAAGQTSFVVLNVASGQSAAVQPVKPGDDQALFVNDEAVRERLTGSRAAANGGRTSNGSGSGSGAAGSGSKPKSGGWFGFGKKQEQKPD